MFGRRRPGLGVGMGRAGRGGRGREMALLMMLLRSVHEIERKPPVTLALMGGMTALYFQKTISPSYFKAFSLCPDKVIFQQQWSRLLASAFLHVDDLHLYHNMLSLLWKGYHLEASLGALRYSLVLGYLLVLSHALVVVLAVVLDAVFQFPGPLRSCCIGFSGVLFALKVLLNHRAPAFSTVYGFRVPTKYAAWLELVMVHVFVPHTSFMGHACGILAGSIYVMSRSEKMVIDPASKWLSQHWCKVVALHRADDRAASASSPRERNERRQQQEEQQQRTADLHQRYSRYEQTQVAAEPPPEVAPITPEELRRRRVARFQDT